METTCVWPRNQRLPGTLTQPPLKKIHMKILVVDDELFLANALCEYLSQEGYDCVPAGSGSEALDLVTQHDPDVVITDFNMEGMTGIQLLQLLRGKDPEIRVIILTGFPDIENAIEAVNYGATAYFRKPLELDELLTTLKEISQTIATEKKRKFYQDSLKKECSRLRTSLSALEHMLNQYKKRIQSGV
jgi:YesN/AraC family two-component response regulator